ncbi:Hypothetical protein ING2D1G_1461 [Peptoniphilus sp. ING2-D1G]|nr:Hypothetical protein ING2D1G_1461 [Peptoniphilus sp. ING2-D1G]
MSNGTKKNYPLKYKKQIRTFLILLAVSFLLNIWLFTQSISYKSALADLTEKYEEAKIQAQNSQADAESSAKIKSLESEIQRLKLQNEDLENNAAKNKKSSAFELSEEYGDFVITVDGVNVRKSPGLSGKVVDQFNKGYVFTAYDSSKINGTTWYGFYLNNEDTEYSWVSSALVKPFEP